MSLYAILEFELCRFAHRGQKGSKMTIEKLRKLIEGLPDNGVVMAWDPAMEEECEINGERIVGNDIFLVLDV